MAGAAGEIVSGQGELELGAHVDDGGRDRRKVSASGEGCLCRGASAAGSDERVDELGKGLAPGHHPVVLGQVRAIRRPLPGERGPVAVGIGDGQGRARPALGGVDGGKADEPRGDREERLGGARLDIERQVDLRIVKKGNACLPQPGDGSEGQLVFDDDGLRELPEVEPGFRVVIPILEEDLVGARAALVGSVELEDDGRELRPGHAGDEARDGRGHAHRAPSAPSRIRTIHDSLSLCRRTEPEPAGASYSKFRSPQQKNDGRPDFPPGSARPGRGLWPPQK